MSQAIEDLKSEVVSMGESVSKAIAAETAALEAAIAKNDDAAISTAVANFKTIQGTLDAFTASITPPPAEVPPVDAPPVDTPVDPAPVETPVV